MKNCKQCCSHAINHHLHGRDGSGSDLCDVCYWRTRAEMATAEIERLRNERDRLLFALRTIKACAGNPEFVFTTARDVLAEFDSIIEQKR